MKRQSENEMKVKVKVKIFCFVFCVFFIYSLVFNSHGHISAKRPDDAMRRDIDISMLEHPSQGIEISQEMYRPALFLMQA
jgi:hypothetical protein